MRVVFLEDVAGVAQGGEVKEVKNGFARNYLIPKNLAVPASHNALQRIERLKRQAEATRLQRLADMKALADELEGMLVNIEMRAGASGRLYGSVTNGIVADGLAKLIGREIDRRTIEIVEPIRELGIHNVNVRLQAEVEAGIKLLVYAAGTDPADALAAIEAEAEAAEAEGEEPEAEAEPVSEDLGDETEDIAEDQGDETEGEEPEAEAETVAEDLGDEPEDIAEDQGDETEGEEPEAEAETVAKDLGDETEDEEPEAEAETVAEDLVDEAQGEAGDRTDKTE